MITMWRTLTEIAADRGISLDEARGLIKRTNCPKLFKTAATYYLL